MSKVTKYNLKSRARLIHIEGDNLPMTIISAWFRVGSQYDPLGKEGLAHLFEHLFMARTESYPEPYDFMRALESKGIVSNAFTNIGSTRYTMRQLPEQTMEAVGFMIDGLNNSLIQSEHLESERGAIYSEIAENVSNENNVLWWAANNGLWPNSGIGRKLLGTRETVDNITYNDFIEFKNRYYNSDNLTFVIVGKCEIEKVINYIDENYVAKVAKTKLVTEQYSEPELLTLHKSNIDEVHVALSFRAPSIYNDNDLYVLDMIRNYLAEGWISTLIHELRIKRNRVYWVDSELNTFADTGMLRFMFTTSPEYLNECLSVIYNEIKGLQNDLVSEEELEVHKVAYVSRLTQGHYTADSLLDWYAWPAIFDARIDTLDDAVEIIKSITPNDIKQVAQKYLTRENMSLTCLGDVPNEAEVNLLD